jgi:hypothetical protein
MPGVESGAEDTVALTNVKGIPPIPKPEEAHAGFKTAQHDEIV